MIRVTSGARCIVDTLAMSASMKLAVEIDEFCSRDKFVESNTLSLLLAEPSTWAREGDRRVWFLRQVVESNALSSPGFHGAREGDYGWATDVLVYDMVSNVFPLTALHTEMCERSEVSSLRRCGTRGD